VLGIIVSWFLIEFGSGFCFLETWKISAIVEYKLEHFDLIFGF